MHNVIGHLETRSEKWNTGMYFYQFLFKSHTRSREYQLGILGYTEGKLRRNGIVVKEWPLTSEDFVFWESPHRPTVEQCYQDSLERLDFVEAEMMGYDDTALHRDEIDSLTNLPVPPLSAFFMEKGNYADLLEEVMQLPFSESTLTAARSMATLLNSDIACIRQGATSGLQALLKGVKTRFEKYTPFVGYVGTLLPRDVVRKETAAQIVLATMLETEVSFDKYFEILRDSVSGREIITPLSKVVESLEEQRDSGLSMVVLDGHYYYNNGRKRASENGGKLVQVPFENISVLSTDIRHYFLAFANALR